MIAPAPPDALLITGASTGIGHATVLHFAARGFRVFAGVRRPADADALVETGAERVHPLQLDVTHPKQLAAACQQAAALLGDAGLFGLVNNAGIAVPGPLEILPIDALRRQLEVNTVGPVAVAQTFLPLLRRARRPATVVNISSLSGRFALPFMGAYAASKFALEAITDALRVELRPWKIRVVSVEPGAVATPIWTKTLASGGNLLDSLPASVRRPYQPLIDFARQRTDPDIGIPPQKVVRAIERALTARRPRARYVVGNDARLRLLLDRLPTRLRDWLIARRLPDYGDA